MIDLKSGIRLSKEEVIDLLEYFDDSSDRPLHEGLDFDAYSDKLSKYAYFTLAYLKNLCVGFIAYYLNDEGRFVYVPQVVVHKCGRHQGVGHLMFIELYAKCANKYRTVELEVLKDN